MNDEQNKDQAEESCCCGGDACGDSRSPVRLSRRAFLYSTAVASIAAGLRPPWVYAKPEDVLEAFHDIIPLDKGLDEARIRALFARGEPEWFTGQELSFIGMPVGGVTCGQVYLSGDGRLWHWDIFNQGVRTASAGPNYAKPMQVHSRVDLGFSLRVKADGREQTRALDETGFSQVRFRGAYPMGFVEFEDRDVPVSASLEAFSPFAPLDVDGSSQPMTVMRYTLHNRSQSPVEVALSGALTNPTLLFSGVDQGVKLVNRIVEGAEHTSLHCTAQRASEEENLSDSHPEIVFADFESETYEGWTVEGTAFGAGPMPVDQLPSYQQNVGARGNRVVTSHHTRDGEGPSAADAHTGTLTSRPFKIERNFVHAMIGGGRVEDGVSFELLIDGEVVESVAGDRDNALKPHVFNVTEYRGREGTIRIVDNGTGSWGHINVDHIVFSNVNDQAGPIDNRPDMGNMTLAVFATGEDVFSESGQTEDFTLRSKGQVGKTLRLAPGEKKTVSFAVAWYFPNRRTMTRDEGYYYETLFPSSLAVIEQYAAAHDASYARTRLWHDTWYDSTLPYWLLDRTFVNVSVLASGTCLRTNNGRFWGWEGVGCCAGTCTHVWHYAQAIGRVFPELERITREHVDYGEGFSPNGMVWYRGWDFPNADKEALDGQAGTILRVYREHMMQSDDAFLRRIWPQVKKSIQFLIEHDGDDNGVLEGEQYNTLDDYWYGPMSWLSSLYIASLRAGAEMALEMGDEPFAKECNELARLGGEWISENLLDGEYFFHKRDPEFPEAFGAGIGSHIDQVLGQGWAHQLGLGRILPQDQTVSALQSLWRYNFTPDVGPFREKYEAGRWYAMPGEPGLIMTTFPKGGEAEARGSRPGHGFAGYFNECMTGFEYQAASHMVAEGLVKEGLAVVHAIHDRYHPSRRNPYNEIECGDHYARAMASYGVFITACGFEYHGPKGHIGFAPRLTPEDFRAPFIAAEGWGTFAQKIEDGTCTATIDVGHGQLKLATIALAHDGGNAVRVRQGTTILPATSQRDGNRVLITLASPMNLTAGESLEISIS